MSLVGKLYQVATFTLSLPLFFVMLLKKRGRARILERYGRWGLELRQAVWFHAPSMGEITGLLPVIKGFKERYPGKPILVTATSVTGLEKAAPFATHTRLLPLDSGLWLSLALRKVDVQAFIFSETELWPALIEYLHRRGVPLYLVNARISDHTFERYKSVRFLLSPLLRKMASILTSNRLAAERFVALGADPRIVEVAGNSKYDVRPAIKSAADAETLRQKVFALKTPVLVLGSLRPGEEQIWFPAIKQAFSARQECAVVVAPRHLDKCGFFKAALTELELSYDSWSALKERGAASEKNIVILDTMGELNAFYSLAQVAFVGATLVNIGGHNPLEPAAYGACPALGPYVQNIPDVAAALREQDAVLAVEKVADACSILQRLSAGDPALQAMGARAREVWSSYSGTASKILDKIQLKEHGD